MALLKFLSNISGGEALNPLTQSQVEALIDALAFAMLIDRRIASEEQEALRTQLQKHPWDTAMPLEHYINEGIRRARNVFESDGSDGQTYLRDISVRLATPEVRHDVFLACVEMARVDGDFAETERDLLQAMGEAFELDAVVVSSFIEA